MLRQVVSPPPAATGGAAAARCARPSTASSCVSIRRARRSSPPARRSSKSAIQIELEIVADLLSTDAVKVRPGFPVLIDGWGGDKTLRGRVRLVEPAGFTKISALGVEEQRVNVLIDFDEGAQRRTSARGRLSRRGQHHHLGAERRAENADERAIPRRRGAGPSSRSATEERRRPGADRQRNAIEAEVLRGWLKATEVIVHPGDTVEDGVAVSQR